MEQAKVQTEFRKLAELRRYRTEFRATAESKSVVRTQERRNLCRDEVPEVV